jgi:DNA-binding PadR family transcriptional regulator
MQKFNPLRVLLLAYLQSVDSDGSTRYEAMININQIFSEIDTPYSPGAFYHEVKKLAMDSLIEISHDRIAITQAGLSWLREQITLSPLPASITGKIYYLCAASLLRDQSERTQALKRVEIQMINNNHINANSDREAGAISLATGIWRSQLNSAIKRSILELSA